jgi:hypothetical protein
MAPAVENGKPSVEKTVNHRKNIHCGDDGRRLKTKRPGLFRVTGRIT